MEKLSSLTYIDNVPEDPVRMFSDLLEAQKVEKPDQKYLVMNIATVDSEYGALDRSVVYRGLTDDHITFVTYKNTRKYANIMSNPKVSVTFYLGMFSDSKGVKATWQVRVFGEATELTANQISNLWSEDPVFAKIRSHICESGKPIDHAKLQEAHDALLKAYESGQDTLPQAKTYTAFNIIPTVWDFYKSHINSIADRVQYRKEGDSWKIMHVAA